MTARCEMELCRNWTGYGCACDVLDMPRVRLCCDLHGTFCEPPSELCCESCTEAEHPRHPEGFVCVLDQGGAP